MYMFMLKFSYSSLSYSATNDEHGVQLVSTALSHGGTNVHSEMTACFSVFSAGAQASGSHESTFD